MKQTPVITTLIFDLGGVLVDLDWDRCVNNFKKIGVSVMENLISTTLQKGFILDYELGLISDDDFRNEVRKYSERKLTDDEINEAWTSLLVGIPDEKLQLLLDLRKNYKILMLSNTNALSYGFCRDVLFKSKGLTVDDYFDTCYLSYEMHVCKPEPAIFEALLKDAELRAEECFFFDDGSKNVEVAKQMGFNVQYIKPYSSVEDWDMDKLLKK